VREIEALQIGIGERVVRQCSQLIARQVHDAQLLQRSENLRRDIRDLIPREKQYLHVPGVFEAIEIHLDQSVMPQIEPLQMRHVTKDIPADVFQLIVRHVQMSDGVFDRSEVVSRDVGDVIIAEV